MTRPIAFRSSATQPLASALSQRRPSSRRPGTDMEAFVETTLKGGLARMVGVPLLWLRRQRHRYELASLSDAQLRDVGLNPALVRRENAKFFWQE